MKTGFEIVVPLKGQWISSKKIDEGFIFLKQPAPLSAPKFLQGWLIGGANWI